MSECETAGADRIMCTTCRLGGLMACAAQTHGLPLVESERPKVIYRGRLWTAGPAGPIHFTRLDDPNDWSVS